jgi:hypothetical protein
VCAQTAFSAGVRRIFATAAEAEVARVAAPLCAATAMQNLFVVTEGSTEMKFKRDPMGAAGRLLSRCRRAFYELAVPIGLRHTCRPQVARVRPAAPVDVPFKALLAREPQLPGRSRHLISA